MEICGVVYSSNSVWIKRILWQGTQDHTSPDSEPEKKSSQIRGPSISDLSLPPTRMLDTRGSAARRPPGRKKAILKPDSKLNKKNSQHNNVSRQKLFICMETRARHENKSKLASVMKTCCSSYGCCFGAWTAVYKRNSTISKQDFCACLRGSRGEMFCMKREVKKCLMGCFLLHKLQQ